MSQQLPGGFPNVQRLQQFAGNQYGQGPMATPFQGAPTRPQLAGAYPQAAPPVLRAPGPPAPWVINPAATPAMAAAKANWQNGPGGGAAPISTFYANGPRLAPTPPVYNPASSPAQAIAKAAPVSATPAFQPLAPPKPPPPPVYTPAPPPAAVAAPMPAPVSFPPVSAPLTYTPGQAPQVPYVPYGSRLSDRREKRVLSLKDILGS